MPSPDKQDSGADDQACCNRRPCVAHGQDYGLLDIEPASRENYACARLPVVEQLWALPLAWSKSG
jgi:hypothetical protein